MAGRRRRRGSDDDFDPIIANVDEIRHISSGLDLMASEDGRAYHGVNRFPHRSRRKKNSDVDV
jgi:hypothetical protein